MAPKTKVEDVGGVFIYANDPKALAEWYKDKLGIELAHYDSCEEGNYSFVFDLGGGAVTAFAVKQANPRISGPRNHFMINFRVSDFDGFVRQLKANGVTIERTQEDDDFGRFGWIKDLEGNPIEFWQAK